MSFAGKRILSLESRRATETAELIRRHGGDPFVAPSMREVPLDRNEAAFAFAERVIRGDFDMVILLTGVGTRYLAKLVATRYPEPRFAEALGKVCTVARGPKPAAALREMGLNANVLVPEPNTWREIVTAIEHRPERRIAVQEYGKSSDELTHALQARGAEVTAVPVYQWDLPEDLGPLREAIHRLAGHEFEVVMFTTSTQIVHLMQVASEMHLSDQVREGLAGSFIASIGPTTTETLHEYGFEPRMEPSHPKLGILVKEAAEAVV